METTNNAIAQALQEGTGASLNRKQVGQVLDQLFRGCMTTAEELVEELHDTIYDICEVSMMNCETIEGQRMATHIMFLNTMRKNIQEALKRG